MFTNRKQNSKWGLGRLNFAIFTALKHTEIKTLEAGEEEGPPETQEGSYIGEVTTEEETLMPGGKSCELENVQRITQFKDIWFGQLADKKLYKNKTDFQVYIGSH